MKELDIKQLNKINDIVSFFGIKGLDNMETKAMISINFINNELFICKRFTNNAECKYGEKAEKICREFVDSRRMNSTYEFLLDGDVTSSYIRSKDYFNEKIFN
jgi:hypothetical protein